MMAKGISQLRHGQPTASMGDYGPHAPYTGIAVVAGYLTQAAVVVGVG